MATDLIHDRGRGPEIIGTRITVYNLLPYLLDPTATELHICQAHDLTAEQVAAARAYVLNHPDEVLAEHLKIEAKIAAGNPAAVTERAQRTHEIFEQFRKCIADRDRASNPQAVPSSGERPTRPPKFPTFQQWVGVTKRQS